MNKENYEFFMENFPYLFLEDYILQEHLMNEDYCSTSTDSTDSTDSTAISIVKK